MLHRAVIAGIILFWLVMTSLLVRLELFPAASNMLPIPVEHVFKLMFDHESSPNLILFHGEQRIGDVQLQTHRFPAAAGNPGSARNQFAGTGSTLLNLPGLSAQRMTFRSRLEFDPRMTLQRFDVTAAFYDPKQATPSFVVMVEGEPQRDWFHYQGRRENVILAEQSGPLLTLLDQPELRELGLNPTVLGEMFRRPGPAAEVSARRGVLASKGDKLETLDVRLRQTDALEATVQFSQLGQVLAVQTSLGYSLLDQSLAP